MEVLLLYKEDRLFVIYLWKIVDADLKTKYYQLNTYYKQGKTEAWKF